MSVVVHQKYDKIFCIAAGDHDNNDEEETILLIIVFANEDDLFIFGSGHRVSINDTN